MAFDQRLLQEQRLGLGIGNRNFDILDLAYHGQRLAVQPGGSEVAAYPILQIARLTHIDHLTGLIQHAIDAGTTAEMREEVFVVEWLAGFCGHDPAITARLVALAVD
jgi:hypothetical protein